MGSNRGCGLGCRSQNQFLSCGVHLQGGDFSSRWTQVPEKNHSVASETAVSDGLGTLDICKVSACAVILPVPSEGTVTVPSMCGGTSLKWVKGQKEVKHTPSGQVSVQKSDKQSHRSSKGPSGTILALLEFQSLLQPCRIPPKYPWCWCGIFSLKNRLSW